MQRFLFLILALIIPGCGFVAHVDDTFDLSEPEIDEFAEGLDEYEEPDDIGGNKPLPVWTVEDEALRTVFANAFAASTGMWVSPVIRTRGERGTHHVYWVDECHMTNKETGKRRGWLGYWNKYSDGSETIRICRALQNYPVSLQRVVSHELGHSLGLGHSKGSTDSVMHASTCAHCNVGPEYLTDYDLEILAERSRYNLSEMPDIAAGPVDYEP